MPLLRRGGLGPILLMLARLAVPAVPAAAQGSSDAIGGTFRAPDPEGGTRPVAGVRVAVRVADGAAVGEARTDERGRWSVALPGPGRYTAAIDTGSLPSRLIDSLEAHVLPPYRPPYEVERRRWAILESR